MIDGFRTCLVLPVVFFWSKEKKQFFLLTVRSNRNSSDEFDTSPMNSSLDNWVLGLIHVDNEKGKTIEKRSSSVCFAVVVYGI